MIDWIIYAVVFLIILIFGIKASCIAVMVGFILKCLGEIYNGNTRNL